jgi:nitrogen fixation NifU-like protein
MTDALKGKTVEQARALFDQFHAMLTSDIDTPPAELGKLSVFSGVREFPTRIKCASLAWHTMKAAVAPASQDLRTSGPSASAEATADKQDLRTSSEPVSTE